MALFRDPDQKPQYDRESYVPDRWDRLFFAVFPDADSARRIAHLATDVWDELALRGRPLRPDRLHVTLYTIGNFEGLPEPIVEAARIAAERIHRPAFEVAFERISSFGAGAVKCPNVLHGGTGVEALTELHRGLHESLAAVGIRYSRRPRCTPHMTLLYGDRLAASQRVPPIVWTIREIVLVHSLVGRTVHRPLGRWPLTSPT